MQQGKLLVVTFFVFWAASEVVMDSKPAANSLKWFYVIVNNVFTLVLQKKSVLFHGIITDSLEAP